MRSRLRRAGARAAGAVLEPLQRLDPARFVAGGRWPGELGSVALVGVYRRANGPQVQALLEQLPAGSQACLWALDSPAAELADRTVGSGPGGRLELLNRAVASLDGDCDALVIADDDVSFVTGDLQRLLRLGRGLGFDLFQPAHGRRSAMAYRFTRKRWFTVGRRTTFVEQGPLVVLSPAAQRHLLPFPADFGMGWGIEVRWSRLADVLALGIVDAVAIHHARCGPYGYDTAPEQARLDAELARHQVDRIHDLQHQRLRHGLVGGVRPARRTGADRTR